MNTVIKAVNLNIDKENDSLPILKVGRGSNHIQLAVTLFANGVIYSISSDVSARVHIKKPDKTEVYSDCTINGNVITVPLTTQSTAVEGEAVLKLQLIDKKENSVIYTPECFMIVKAGISDAIIVSSNEFGALEEAVGTIGEYQNQIDTINRSIGSLDLLTTFIKSSLVSSINWLHTKLVNSIANEYNKDISYKIGQYVYYQGVLYICSSAITTPEPWNASHWSIGNLSNLKQNRQWRVLGTRTGNAVFAFTNLMIDINELYIIGFNGTHRYQFYIPFSILSSGSVLLVQGHYYQPNQPIQSGCVAINISNSQVSIAFASNGINDTTTGSIIDIFAR